jgi:hypothetical protein
MHLGLRQGSNLVSGPSRRTVHAGTGRRRHSCRSAGRPPGSSRGCTVGARFARYYDPTTANFLTRDPLEDETGAPYSYSGNDPIDNSDPSGLDWLDDVGNWTAGFGDTITFGGTEQIRRLINYGETGDTSDVGVDHCSTFYTWGGHGGLIASFVPLGGGLNWAYRIVEDSGLLTGREISLGSRFRFSPFGNRNVNKWYMRIPHYHRSVPDPLRPGDSIPGQGIGRHRPWETKSTDTSWWDRW